jgi:hypothetical protein
MVREAAGADVSQSVAIRRLAAQLLAERLPPPATPAQRVEAVVEAVGRVLAVQAQDLRGLRLAIRSRTVGLTVADVDRALAERRLLVTWLNRGTLHLVRAEDYSWLHALTAPRLVTTNRRRLAEEGVTPEDAERGVTLVERAVMADGPRTRTQLRDRLASAGVPVAGQALVHILILASMRGLLIRGPMAGAEQAYVHARDWLGPLATTPGSRDPSGSGGGPAGFDRDGALAELAGRYLAGHGPADDRDLATWAGLPVGDARRGLALAAAAGGVHEVDAGRADRRDRPAGIADRRWDEISLDSLPARLLGPFDPVLHGWAAREWVTGPHRAIVTVNGIFRPIALVGGQAVATWTMPAGRVELAPFAPLTPTTVAALDAQAADVRRFLSGGATNAP